jgi:hypothetical protein
MNANQGPASPRTGCDSTNGEKSGNTHPELPGTIHFDDKSFLHVGVKNESKEKRGFFGWTERIWIPIGAAVIGLVATVGGVWLGARFTSTQQVNAEVERMIARAAEASQARHETVSVYAKNVTDRLTADPDMKDDSTFGKLLLGETIITFKRLDDSRPEGQDGNQSGYAHSEIQYLKQAAIKKITTAQSNPVWLAFLRLVNQDEAYQQSLDQRAKEIVKPMDGFDDADDLKGNLVRFLYESNLLDQREPVSIGNAEDGEPISLVSGADLRRINLSFQPLSQANLRKAYMGWSNLREARLNEANLAGVDLQYADLRNASLISAQLKHANLNYADLRGTNLTDAEIYDVTLVGACYDRHTQGLNEINPVRYGMRYLTDEDSEKTCQEISGFGEYATAQP